MAMVSGTDPVVVGCPFQWYEFSGWEVASAAQLDNGRALVRSVLCPARQLVGTVLVSQGGWIYSRDGYPRSDIHATGAAADVVPGTATVQELYVAIRDLPEAPYGEVLQERDHVHVTLPGYGGQGQALLELPDGTYTVDPDGPAGAVPLQLDYTRPAAAWAAYALAASVAILAFRHSGR
jgi:hypothetical protein